MKAPMRFTRREFTLALGTGVVALSRGLGAQDDRPPSARLYARPNRRTKTSIHGKIPLGLDRERDGVIYVPTDAGDEPLPLLLLFHGASSTGDRQLTRFMPVLETMRLAVLAPDSRSGTWDAIRGNFGADIEFVDRALKRLFEKVTIDPARMAIGGFSDGATYALSVGLSNGDVFRNIFAFSPGFVIVNEPWRGRPRVFVSHGTSDQILNIDRTSRQIVPGLTKRGYDVTYREFDGRHEAPPDLVREALTRTTSVPAGV